MKLKWDQTGEKYYETGTRQGVLFPQKADGTYDKGVAWNGLTQVQETPSGAEANPQYADDIKYLNLYSAEDFGATVEAFTYPDEFALCDGSADLATGVKIGQQARTAFGLSFTSRIGNDVQGSDYGYKLHIIYGAMASPSERAYQTINDSPEPITFSWELTTTPVTVDEIHKPTSLVTIDSTKADPDKLATLEGWLYGTESTESRLPLPAEILSLFEGGSTDTYVLTTDTEVASGKTYYTRTGSEEPYTYTPVENPTGNPSQQGWYEKVEG